MKLKASLLLQSFLNTVVRHSQLETEPVQKQYSTLDGRQSQTHIVLRKGNEKAAPNQYNTQNGSHKAVPNCIVSRKENRKQSQSISYHNWN